INHLNHKKTDGFMETLLQARTDLAGLPVAMGDACRTKADRRRHFTQAVNTVRSALSQRGARTVALTGGMLARPPAAAPATSQAPGSGSGTMAPSQQPAPPPPPTMDMVVLSAQPAVAPANRAEADAFWDRYHAACRHEDKANAREDRGCREH